MPSPAFPTARHQSVADLAARFFKGHAEVDTVLVVNSCARGRATPESDLDLAVLVKPPLPAQRCQQLEMAWLSFGEANTQLVEFRCASRFAHVHVDVFDGQFVTTIWDDGGGPDSFEVEIGNRV
ncbi:MAG TPA: nucleotidyltransferase domain-containing protein, partial [Vicinamibacterales bacterium]|nr:nucleotidyltransferase domain-containing protein [Vicinamibacterales bacterium]